MLREKRLYLSAESVEGMYVRVICSVGCAGGSGIARALTSQQRTQVHGTANTAGQRQSKLASVISPSTMQSLTSWLAVLFPMTRLCTLASFVLPPNSPVMLEANYGQRTLMDTQLGAFHP